MLDFLHEMFDQTVDKMFSTRIRIADGRSDFKNTISNFQYADIDAITT